MFELRLRTNATPKFDAINIISAYALKTMLFLDLNKDIVI